MLSSSRQPKLETEAGSTMGEAGDNKERNREIAHNEEVRQTTGDIRVSVWAIVFAVIIVAGVVWVWIKH